MPKIFLALTLFFFVGTFGLGDPVISLELLTTNLTQPVFLTHAGDGSGRLFIVEQAGTIQIFKDGDILPTAFLDIRNKVTSGDELGLLGLAFHPDFENNRRFYVNYTQAISAPLRTVVAEYKASQDNPDLADFQEKVILEFNQPFSNHNGGMLAFGPDGFLYVGTGDGGSAGDPLRNAQNRGRLLGKILRIDVDKGDPYSIPSDNPLVGEADAREEIWAYGLRNPWRFSFDRSGGRLFAADVGQDNWEEVDLIIKGGNYGWNIMEATHCFPPEISSCNTTGLILPINEYDHSEGKAVTGGYVYRGQQNTPLWGSYIFGDFLSGRIWALTERPGGVWERKELLLPPLSISSFGEDEQGELYLLDHGNGRAYQIQFGWRELLAHAGDGITPGGSFQSIILVVNNGDEELSGTLRFFSRDGMVQALQVNGIGGQDFVVSTPSRSAVSLTTSGSADPFFVGWAEVTANVPFSASLLLILRAAEGEPIAEAGTSSSVPGQHFSAFVSRESLFDINTGVAVANPSENDSVLVTMTLKDDESVTTSRVIQLGPRQQSAEFLQKIADIGTDFQGTINVSATGDVIVTILRTKNSIHSASLPVGN